MKTHNRHWFFEGMTQMNWTGVPGSATKQCFSWGAT